MKIYKIAVGVDPATLQNASSVLTGTIVPALTTLNSISGNDLTLKQMVANSLETGDTKEMEESMGAAVQAIQQIVAALPALQNSGLDLNVITEAIRGGDIPQLQQIVKSTIQSPVQQ